MVGSLFQEFKELVSLTKQYIEQEHPSLSSKKRAQKEERKDHLRSFEKVQGQNVCNREKSSSFLGTEKLKTEQFNERQSPQIIVSNEVKNASSAAASEKIKNEKELEVLSNTFHLEPITVPLQDPLNDINQVVRKLFPKIVVLDQVLEDAVAQQVKNQWQEEVHNTHEVIFLSGNESKIVEDFFSNIVKALLVYDVKINIMSATKIEKGLGWDHFLKTDSLKLIITSSHSLQLFPGLMKHYQGPDVAGMHFLGLIPLLIVEDPSHYFKEPYLKLSLWQTIVIQLQALGLGRT